MDRIELNDLIDVLTDDNLVDYALIVCNKDGDEGEHLFHAYYHNWLSAPTLFNVGIDLCNVKTVKDEC
jgi:hypothetical protein